jgi:polyhydroxybutyrate depolymerase
MRGAGLVLGVVLCVSVVACSSSVKKDSAAPSTAANVTGGPTSRSAPPGTVPASRPVSVHVPPGYKAAAPAPLLVLLHGYGASGAIQDAYMALTKTADAHHMLYVHPDGTKNPVDKRFWTATDACCTPPGSKVDDSAYLSAVINQVKRTYNVDPRRVFIIGHSNGGFMAYRMACDHADVIAAVVSIEGSTFADPNRCHPSQPVATLEVHGTADRTIPYAGGSIAGHPYPGAQTTTKIWATYNGCRTDPDTPAPAARPVVADLPLATVVSYSEGCKRGGHAELWTQPAGVHIPHWSSAFDEEIVQFLLAHPKP